MNIRPWQDETTLPLPLLTGADRAREFANTEAAVHQVCGACGGMRACPTPQACHQPEWTQPSRSVRAWNAVRRLVLRPYLALLQWQLDCLRDERERYDELGWASPTYLRNCFQQELELMARIRQLETDQ